MHALYTGTLGALEPVVAELKTCPHRRSTHTLGVPVCSSGLFVFVAQGMVIQSVVH
jgi:hypothetical protein